MLTCKGFDKFLDDYLAGRLGTWASVRFKTHLALCPPCKRYIVEYQRAVEAARAAGNMDHQEPIPEELARAIAEALAEEAKKRPTG